MGLIYKRGTTITYYCSFTTLDNKEPTTIVDPKITIRHIDSSNILVTDVNEAAMTLASENTYFYKWAISTGADLGEYTIECEALVDTEYAEDNQNVQVIE